MGSPRLTQLCHGQCIVHTLLYYLVCLLRRHFGASDHNYVQDLPLYHGMGEVARGTHKVFIGKREVGANDEKEQSRLGRLHLSCHP